VTGKDVDPGMQEVRMRGMPWDSRELVFNVREPYPSRSTGAELVFGRISSGEPLRIRSLMPENGVIFSDGIEADGLDFRCGLKAVVEVHSRWGCLLQ
jgi:hypothetical protein